jgi:hypothetical protein
MYSFCSIELLELVMKIKKKQLNKYTSNTHKLQVLKHTIQKNKKDLLLLGQITNQLEVSFKLQYNK